MTHVRPRDAEGRELLVPRTIEYSHRLMVHMAATRIVKHVESKSFHPGARVQRSDRVEDVPVLEGDDEVQAYDPVRNAIECGRNGVRPTSYEFGGARQAKMRLCAACVAAVDAAD